MTDSASALLCGCKLLHSPTLPFTEGWKKFMIPLQTDSQDIHRKLSSGKNIMLP